MDCDEPDFGVGGWSPNRGPTRTRKPDNTILIEDKASGNATRTGISIRPTCRLYRTPSRCLTVRYYSLIERDWHKYARIVGFDASLNLQGVL